MKIFILNKWIIGILFLIVSLNGISQDKQINMPTKNFEELWSNLNEHYAFFESKKINWKEMYDKYRPLINENTSNDSLFNVCCKMISELDDRHTQLIDKKTGKKCHSGKPIRLLKEFPTNDSLKLLLNTIDATLTNNQFADFTRIKMKVPYLYGNVIEYTNNGTIGYIRINLMYGLSKRELNKVLENVVEGFNNVNGIIIDVRFNSGGYDKYSFMVAGKFVNKEYIGHYKCTKKKEGFTELKPRYLKPVGEKQLVKPTVILTSDQSMSATDVFVLIMEDLPYVTIIGDNTKGIFSDIKEFRLPNGWKYTFSSQKYLSANMKNYEGIGITPDILKLNTRNDLKTGIDPLVLEAIKVLNQKATNN